MEALDGNAIAGVLQQVFGAELTTAVGECAHCGTVAVLAQAVVYLGGPGRVVRCRTCAQVQMVLVEVRGVTCVDRRGLRRLG